MSVGRKVGDSSSSRYSNSSIIVEVIVYSISGALTKTQSSWRFWVLYKLPQKFNALYQKILFIFIIIFQFGLCSFFQFFFVHQDDRES